MRYGVTLETWQTDQYSKSSGQLAAFKRARRGEAVGHASLSVTFPANAEGEALIKKYCKDSDVKYFKFRNEITTLDQNNKPHTRYEDAYMVYFSWWPMALNTRKEDEQSERMGRPVTLSTRFYSPLEIVSMTQNVLDNSDKKVAFGPLQVFHQTLQEQSLEKFYGVSTLTIDEKVDFTDKIYKDMLRIENHFNEDINRIKMLRNEVTDTLNNLLESFPALEASVNEFNHSYNLLQFPFDEDINDITEKFYQKAMEVIAQIPEGKQKDQFLIEFNLILDGKAKFDSLKLLQNHLNVYFGNRKQISEYSLAEINDFCQNATLPGEILYQFCKTIHDLDAENIISDVDGKLIKNELNELVYNRIDYLIKTYGQPADNILYLPIQSIGNQIGIENGLNVEKMLNKMRKLADSRHRETNPVEYSLFDMNCSETVGRILSAGAAPNHRAILNRKPIIKVSSPQLVYNNAVKYQQAIIEQASKKQTKKPTASVANPSEDLEKITQSKSKSNTTLISNPRNPEQAYNEFKAILSSNDDVNKNKIVSFDEKTFAAVHQWVIKNNLQTEFSNLSKTSLGRANAESIPVSRAKPIESGLRISKGKSHLKSSQAQEQEQKAEIDKSHPKSGMS